MGSAEEPEAKQADVELDLRGFARFLLRDVDWGQMMVSVRAGKLLPLRECTHVARSKSCDEKAAWQKQEGQSVDDASCVDVLESRTPSEDESINPMEECPLDGVHSISMGKSTPWPAVGARAGINSPGGSLVLLPGTLHPNTTPDAQTLLAPRSDDASEGSIDVGKAHVITSLGQPPAQFDSDASTQSLDTDVEPLDEDACLLHIEDPLTCRDLSYMLRPGNAAKLRIALGHLAA